MSKIRRIARKIVEKVKKGVKKIDHSILLPVASKSRFLSGIYVMFGRSFMREHYGVVKGKMQYLSELSKYKKNEYLLIRNTHRIEKGLIMKPRRPVFAASYIEETVDCYEAFLKEEGSISNNRMISWANNVLDTYFKAVTEDEKINKLAHRFYSMAQSRIENIEGKTMAPYRRSIKSPEELIDFDQFMELCVQRRSVRWFLDKKVPRELIDKAIEAAAMAPSACNRQPFELRVFDDPEWVNTVGTIPMGTAGFSHNYPVIIVIVGRLNAYFSERDRHLIYIDGSLAAMSLMFALETLGLSSCPINWPDMAEKEKQIKKKLELEDFERPIMLVALGYPDPNEKVPYSAKKVLSKIRRYN